MCSLVHSFISYIVLVSTSYRPDSALDPTVDKSGLAGAHGCGTRDGNEILVCVEASQVPVSHQQCATGGRGTTRSPGGQLRSESHSVLTPFHSIIPGGMFWSVMFIRGALCCLKMCFMPHFNPVLTVL